MTTAGRVGTGNRTETGTRRAPLLGSVSLRALALDVGYWGASLCGILALVLRAWEPASLRALFPREVRLISWDGRPQPRRHSRTRLIGLTGLTQVQQDHGCQAGQLRRERQQKQQRQQLTGRACEGERWARWTRWRARSWAVEQALWQQRRVGGVEQVGRMMTLYMYRGVAPPAPSLPGTGYRACRCALASTASS